MTDKQLIKFVNSFRYGIVGRRRSQFMCFAVCAPLAPLLRLSGVEAVMREGLVKFPIGEGNHFWIELEDGRVIDPTADQFNEILGLNLPKIYLGSPTKIIHTQLAH